MVRHRQRKTTLGAVPGDLHGVPRLGDAAGDSENVVTGVVLHTALSLGFGIGFAIAVRVLPWLRRPAALVGGALVYGLALYVLNFQILGRTAFPFFTNPKGPTRSSS